MKTLSAGSPYQTLIGQELRIVDTVLETLVE